MNPVKFTISFEAAIGLSPELQKGLQGLPTWKYRILDIEVQQLDRSIFRLTLSLHPSDIGRETDLNQLFAFRDRVLSLISVSTMMPVQIRSTCVFTFPLGGHQYEALSLGPMTTEHTPTALESLQPLVQGLSISDSLGVAIYFTWQAINAMDPIYRFINLAICLELLADIESPRPASIHPRCPNQGCDYILEHCPKCSHDWKIPNSLANRVRFLLTDKAFRSRVIKARNKTFHGAQYRWNHEFLEEVAALNIPLLLIIRNYVGSKIGLPPIAEEHLSIAVDTPRIIVRVVYTTPESAKE